MGFKPLESACWNASGWHRAPRERRSGWHGAPRECCAIRDHAVTQRRNPICYHGLGGQLAGLISFVSRKTSPTLSLAIFIGNVPKRQRNGAHHGLQRAIRDEEQEPHRLRHRGRPSHSRASSSRTQLRPRSARVRARRLHRPELRHDRHAPHRARGLGRSQRQPRRHPLQHGTRPRPAELRDGHRAVPQKRLARGRVRHLLLLLRDLQAVRLGLRHDWPAARDALRARDERELAAHEASRPLLAQRLRVPHRPGNVSQPRRHPHGIQQRTTKSTAWRKVLKPRATSSGSGGSRPCSTTSATRSRSRTSR